MHELGLAQSILEIVQRHVPGPRRPAVRLVRMRIGSQAGIVVDSLCFCFEAIVQETPLSGARLEVQDVSGDELQVQEIELDDEPVEVS